MPGDRISDRMSQYGCNTWQWLEYMVGYWRRGAFLVKTKMPVSEDTITKWKSAVRECGYCAKVLEIDRNLLH